MTTTNDTTADFLFTFGPGDTFVICLENTVRCSPNIAAAAHEILQNRKKLHWVAFSEPEGGSTKADPYICYVKSGRFHFSPTIYTPASGSKLEQLEDLLNDKDYKNSEEVQLVTNGKGGFWCRFETKKTYGFSRKIPNAPFQFLKAGNPHGWPVHAAFGVKDSFVFVYSDGHVDWDLKSSYSDLDKVFLKRLTKPKELLFVALNPFAADQFFCAFSDHSVTYSFPSGEAWKEIDEFILSGTGLRVISDSPTLRSSADPSTSSTSGAGTNSLVKFAEKEAKEAAKDMTENAISDWLGN
jgi:hypothetical protein